MLVPVSNKSEIIEKVEWGEKLVEVIHSYNIELFAVQHKELTNKDLTELEAPGRDEERQEEEDVAEEPKRLTAQEMSSRFSLFGK